MLRVRRRILSAAGVLALTGAMGTFAALPATAANQTVAWAFPTTGATTVSVGDTVTWDWNDSAPHSVTSVTAPVTFDSGVLTGADQTFAFTFTEAGTYTYRCVIHPDVMTGTVTVQAAQASTTPAPAPPTAVPASPTAGATTAPTTPPLTGAKSITLTGAEEVPAVSTTATGSFQWRIDGQSLAYTLKASGTGLTMAHIHIGEKGANGPVVAFLFGPNPAGVDSIDVSGTITVAQLTGSLAGDWNGFIAALNRGGTYVNVHSTANPAGVVRGQIPASATTAGPTVPATGSGLESSNGGGFALPAAGMLAALIITGGALVAIQFRTRQTRP